MIGKLLYSLALIILLFSCNSNENELSEYSDKIAQIDSSKIDFISNFIVRNTFSDSISYSYSKDNASENKNEEYFIDIRLRCQIPNLYSGNKRDSIAKMVALYAYEYESLNNLQNFPSIKIGFLSDRDPFAVEKAFFGLDFLQIVDSLQKKTIRVMELFKKNRLEEMSSYINFGSKKDYLISKIDTISTRIGTIEQYRVFDYDYKINEKNSLGEMYIDMGFKNQDKKIDRVVFWYDYMTKKLIGIDIKN